MIRIPILLISLFLTSAVLGKGRAWSYVMLGTVYDKTTKDVLRNTSLMIGKQLVTSDSTGHYELTISGVTCDRGNSRAEIDRCNEEAYGQLVIRRVLSEGSITVRTNWEVHACLDRVTFTPPCFTSRVDLFVP